ncbi:MAG TPA: substrate-binding domain-containing protein [Paucimonas sp.]|nr:substrate-binding domain-containing protein [Paucimonas sp.]
MVVMLGWDFRNPAIAALAAGAKEAAAAAGWTFSTMDCYGLPNRRPESFHRALALKPDAIILAGVDAQEMQKEISLAQKQNIPVVGWHAAATIGPSNGLFTNIGSDPKEAGQIAALFAVADSKGKAGVVVFADAMNAYSAAKSSAMVEIIKQCQTCTLLGVEQTAADAPERAAQFAALAKKYGARWTHAVAGSDQYFDTVAIPMPASTGGTPHLQAIAAGDGIKSAYQRINDNALQIGTVPEPLNMQGWQLIDEVNRAVAGEKPSGYATSTYLVTSQNKAFHGGPKNMFDPNNGYRDEYRKIWKK